jgi:hypothetical protein
MKISLQNIQRLVIASALASGLVSAGVAASAQTAKESAMTNQTTTADAAMSQTTTATAMTTTMRATSLSLSSVDSKAKRQADVEQADSYTRRLMLFRNQNSSL